MSLVGYVEDHHIYPKCLNGSNDRANMVFLTASEHFVAHQLLAKIYPGNSKFINACSLMCIDPYGNRIHNKMYGWLKIKNSEARTGQTKENNKSVAQMAETLNILSKEQRGLVVKLKNEGLLMKEIHQIFNDQGIKIAYSSLVSIYRREKKYEPISKSLELHVHEIIEFIDTGNSFKAIARLFKEKYRFSYDYKTYMRFYRDQVKDRDLGILEDIKFINLIVNLIGVVKTIRQIFIEVRKVYQISYSTVKNYIVSNGLWIN